MKINPFSGAPRQPWNQNLPTDLTQLRYVQKRRWRISPHPARVRAFISVARTLVVLRSGEELRRLAVAQSVKRNLRSLQELLDDDSGPRGAKSLVHQNIINCFISLCHAGADQNAFAQRQPIGFDGAMAIERTGKLLRSLRLRERSRPRGWKA